MSEQKFEEKYFVATMSDLPEFEAVLWCKTLKEAEKELKERKRKFRDEEHILGERLK